MRRLLLALLLVTIAAACGQQPLEERVQADQSIVATQAGMATSYVEDAREEARAVQVQHRAQVAQEQQRDLAVWNAAVVENERQAAAAAEQQRRAAEVRARRRAATTTTTAPPTGERSAYTGGGGGDPNDMASWERLAQCESGGNWAINTGNGYYGGIQFSLASWRGVGGQGYPHQASKAEQIRRGQMLYSSGGWGHWPGCTHSFGWR